MKRDLLVLRKQERDPAKREKVAFQLPAGGRIGEDIRAFFALADGEEERYGMPVSEFAPHFPSLCPSSSAIFFSNQFSSSPSPPTISFWGKIVRFFYVVNARLTQRFPSEAVLLLEAVGRYQVIGLGVGDWKALG